MQLRLGALCSGFNEITSVIVLGSEASVDKLKRTESTAGFDGSLIVGRNSAIDGMAEDGMECIPFSLADGALLDVSFKGEEWLREVMFCMRTAGLGVDWPYDSKF